MKISESIFSLEDSPNVSQERVRSLAKSMLDRYKAKLREWGYDIPPGYAELDENEELLSRHTVQKKA
ncbi:MAG: hypothetical protein ACRERD_18895 [Candidatus Binatia bacterium]